MIYYLSKKKLLEGLQLNLLTDTIKVALFTQAYIPNLAVDEFLSDIIAYEAAMTGYTTGGETLVGKTLTLDGAGKLKFDSEDVSWAITGAGSAQQAVIYKDTGDPSTSPLLILKPFLRLRTVINQPFQLEWAAEGIMVLP